MKIRYNLVEIIINVLCIIITLGMLLYIAISWRNLPEQIPLHFNYRGEVTNWGGKGSVLILPLTGLFLMIIMTVAERFPRLWNMGIKVTKQNINRIYPIMKSMLISTKFIILAWFLILTIYQVNALAMPIWLMIAPVALLFVVMIGYTIAFIRNR